MEKTQNNSISKIANHLEFFPDGTATSLTGGQESIDDF